MKKVLLWIKTAGQTLLNHIKTFIRVLKIKIRKARAEFRKKERTEQTRYAYIALTVGTVVVALELDPFRLAWKQAELVHKQLQIQLFCQSPSNHFFISAYFTSCVRTKMRTCILMMKMERK